MLLNWGNSQGLNALMNSAEFIAGFADKGSGEVDLVLSRGTGSATFTRATTATTVNSAGLIVSVASGTPRSYYDPTTLAYLGYLSEGARTNLCLQSADLSTTWSQTEASVSTNASTDPSGATLADSVIENSAVTTNHQVSQTITYTNAVHTFSVFAKAGARTWIRILIFDGTTVWSSYFNLGTGVVGTVAANTTAAITAHPNGWYRCRITTNSATAAALGNVTIRLATGDSVDSYTGNGTGNALLWGAQLEAGSFASTYIPTTTASVTRNADVLTYPFAGNASATVGTAYAEVSAFQSSGFGNTVILAFRPGLVGPLVKIGGASTDVSIRDNAGNAATKSGITSFAFASQKLASSWGTGLAVTGSGLAQATNATFGGDMGSVAIGIGCATDGTLPTFVTIKNVRIYQTQLSASQLQAVTG